MQLTKRHKNSIFTFVIRLGGVAQLVERLNGIQEVRGSTPLISTTTEKNEPDFIGFFFFSGALRGDAVPPAAWTPSGWRCVYASKLAHFAITQTLFATPPHLHQRRSPMNTRLLQAHRTSSFVTQNHPLTQALTQILFVPERLWILFCFWLSIMRKGQSLSFCGRRERLP